MEGEHSFELVYQSPDPALAARVANRLPEIFVTEAVKVRRTRPTAPRISSGPRSKRSRPRSSDWERKIAAFKVQHMGELPEQLEMNMRGLERVAALMQTKSEELRVAEGRRSDLARSRLAADSEAGRLKAAEDSLTQELVGARTSWTEDHPEVTRLDQELGAMRAKRERAESLMVAERLERGRAARMVENIQQEIEELSVQARAYQERMERTPQWAHALGVLQRDYEIARTKYHSVVSRQVEAQIARELEARGAKDMFRVISPAGVPAYPVRPDRMTGMLVAAAGRAGARHPGGGGAGAA